MKNLCYILALNIMLLLLGSCHQEQLYPPVEPWLCSINADGTGFRKIKKVDLNFGTTGFWDIYMTKDNRIILYGEKLWISGTDVINPVKITPDSLNINHPIRLAQTSDGSKMYFSANKDIFSLSLPGMVIDKITKTESFMWANPILSDDEMFLTVSAWASRDSLIFVQPFIDLSDNSLQKIYTNEPIFIYNSKILNYMNKMLLDYHYGLGSISFLDSLFSNLQSYSGWHNQVFETSFDNEYVISLDGELSSVPKVIAIKLADNTRYDLGFTYNPVNLSSSPVKICKNSKTVFYKTEDNQLIKYDLNTHVKSTVFSSGTDLSVYRILMLAPTWGGNSVYFYAEISER